MTLGKEAQNTDEGLLRVYRHKDSGGSMDTTLQIGRKLFIDVLWKEKLYYVLKYIHVQVKWRTFSCQVNQNIWTLTRGLTIATTLSPALNFFTPGPTCTTSPATSVPVPNFNKEYLQST